MHGPYTADKTKRHAGDIKQYTASTNTPAYEYTDSIATLYGTDTIAGRSLVLHALPDDGTAGTFGPKIACCTIFLTKNLDD